VTVGERDIFFSNNPGPRMAIRYAAADTIQVMHLDGAAWAEENGPWKLGKGKSSSPNLSVIGNRLCAAWCERVGAKANVLMALRGRDGTWKTPFPVATEDSALTNLIMPRESPPNFVPVAWAAGDREHVKVRRIPIGEIEK
jgi:hypothetical protein